MDPTNPNNYAALQEAGVKDLPVDLPPVYDDTEVLPLPRSRIGSVLVDGVEVERLVALEAALSSVLGRHVDHNAQACIQDAGWSAVVEAATRVLTALVLAGGLHDP